MNEQAVLIAQLIGRISMVWLCYYAVIKFTACTQQCCRWRYQTQNALGWISGAVACVGLFYPVICGAAAVVLVLALWMTDLNYGKNTGRFTAKASAGRDAGSQVGS